MDYTKFSINELKKLRDTYRQDLSDLKNELQIVKAAIHNPQSDTINELQSIRETRYSRSNSSDASGDEATTSQELLQTVTKIKIINISMKPGESDTYVHTCNAKFDKLHFIIEYESNLPHNVEYPSTTEENLTKLMITIVKPNIQPKLQKGIEYFQQNPNNLSSAILFLKSINDLMEQRSIVVKKLYEFEKNLNIGISKSTDQHSIIFKSEFDNAEFLHVKWNFKWEIRTGLARDLITAKIIRADDQLMAEMKPLVEKLCSDKFAFESATTDKINLFHTILTSIKDADTRNISDMLS